MDKNITIKNNRLIVIKFLNEEIKGLTDTKFTFEDLNKDDSDNYVIWDVYENNDNNLLKSKIIVLNSEYLNKIKNEISKTIIENISSRGSLVKTKTKKELILFKTLKVYTFKVIETIKYYFKNYDDFKEIYLKNDLIFKEIIYINFEYKRKIFHISFYPNEIILTQNNKVMKIFSKIPDMDEIKDIIYKSI